MWSTNILNLSRDHQRARPFRDSGALRKEIEPTRINVLEEKYYPIRWLYVNLGAALRQGWTFPPRRSMKVLTICE